MDVPCVAEVLFPMPFCIRQGSRVFVLFCLICDPWRLGLRWILMHQLIYDLIWGWKYFLIKVISSFFQRKLALLYWGLLYIANENIIVVFKLLKSTPLPEGI